MDTERDRPLTLWLFSLIFPTLSGFLFAFFIIPNPLRDLSISVRLSRNRDLLLVPAGEQKGWWQLTGKTYFEKKEKNPLGEPSGAWSLNGNGEFSRDLQEPDKKIIIYVNRLKFFICFWQVRDRSNRFFHAMIKVCIISTRSNCGF